MSSQGKPPSPFLLELGRRLRAERVKRGWSLRQLQVISGGRWKAVVVGAYERGDRGISAQKIVELAGFYQAPVCGLLPAIGEPAAEAEGVVL
jgi:transcriptional regulator with XRE-family HTH domain